MGHFKELIVYAKAFDLAMEIFNLSRSFPDDERYGLTSQMRRSSRSVCSNIAEGYRKRRYPAHFTSKITDADMENTETQVWLEFAIKCGYIDSKTNSELAKKADEIGRLLNYMLKNPSKFL
jgi:four helix bundle protein